MKEKVVIIDADEFLGDFDGLRFHPLTTYVNTDTLINAVFKSDFDDLVDHIAEEEATIESRQHPDSDDSGHSPDYQETWKRNFARQQEQLEDLGEELRDHIREYVRKKMSVSGLPPTGFEQVYFTQGSAYLYIRSSPEERELDALIEQTRARTTNEAVIGWLETHQQIQKAFA